MLAVCPNVFVAVALMTCVPREILWACHDVEQELVLVHVLRVVPPALILIEATLPPTALALAAMLRLVLPLSTMPFAGELIATVGAAPGVAIDTLEDRAEVLPAAS